MEVIRGGRILLNLHGIIKIKFTWVLGMKTKNQVEMYGLLQGLCISRDKGTKHSIILLDSLLIIHYLVKENTLKDNSMGSVL